MTIPSQDYAILSNDSYQDRRVGRRDENSGEQVAGTRYEVVDHVNNKNTGYQGTIYRNMDTRELVVAHRGTEFEGEFYRDLVRADGSMVVNRTNPQAADAIDLTRRAMQYAQAEGERSGHAPQVTVTGHSLGGALAQVSAHHFDLKGETFNAYGAASLGYRIPEGGNAMVNHVMGADFVSAASGHYGQVKVYTNQAEIDRLGQGGFSNSRFNGLMPDAPLVTAGRSISSHMMHNFLDVDANGRPDRSVLGDPQAQKLATDNARMIDEYRDDIRGLRAGVTVLSRGPIGLAKDAYDGIRGPLPAGEPARIEERERRERSHSSIGPLMNDSRHEGNRLYQDAERGVFAQDARVGREPTVESRQLAGVLAERMHGIGARSIDDVVMSRDGSTTFAVQGRNEDPSHLRVGVETQVAMRTPLEESTRRLEGHTSQQSQEQGQQLDRQQNEARSARAMG